MIDTLRHILKAADTPLPKAANYALRIKNYAFGNTIGLIGVL